MSDAITAPARRCPRCGEPLQPGSYEGVEVQLCAGCGGMIVSRRRMIPLMERLCAALRDEVDADRPIDPAPAGAPATPCPACSRRMDQMPYMGSELATVDACEVCDALWLDPATLGTMTLLWARTERRLSVRRAELARQETADLVRVTMLARRVQRSLLGGFISQLLP